MSVDAPSLTVTAVESAGPGTQVLDARGDLVVTSREPLRAAVEVAIASGRPRIVLACARLGHVDMAGFALLYRLHERCVAAGGTLFLAALPQEFRDVARALRLDEHIPFTDTVEAAVTAP